MDCISTDRNDHLIQHMTSAMHMVGCRKMQGTPLNRSGFLRVLHKLRRVASNCVYCRSARLVNVASRFIDIGTHIHAPTYSYSVCVCAEEWLRAYEYACMGLRIFEHLLCAPCWFFGVESLRAQAVHIGKHIRFRNGLAAEKFETKRKVQR